MGNNNSCEITYDSYATYSKSESFSVAQCNDDAETCKKMYESNVLQLIALIDSITKGQASSTAEEQELTLPEDSSAAMKAALMSMISYVALLASVDPSALTREQFADAKSVCNQYLTAAKINFRVE
jgi:hypothetical protein